METNIKYFKVYRNKFDKRNNENAINFIALMTNTFKRQNYDYTKCSDKNYGYDSLMPFVKADKPVIYLKAVTQEFVTNCCIHVEENEVDIPELIQEVNRLNF